LGAEEDIWVEEGRGNREWRKLHNEELHGLYSSSSSSSSSGITVRNGPYPCSTLPIRFPVVSKEHILYGVGLSALTCRTRLSLSVCVVSLGLSNAEDLASSCDNASTYQDDLTTQATPLRESNGTFRSALPILFG
jgi:hypothetical protein